MSISRRPAGALGLFALVTLGFAAPAFAADDLVVDFQPEAGTVTRTLKVDVSDLRLASAEGRSRAKDRVIRAAKKVCDYNGGYGLRQPKDYERCFTQARSEALSDPRLVQTASR
jgi:UrcA family protein